MMVEFLSARYSVPPWITEMIPIYKMRHWFDIAIKNVEIEGALTLKSLLGKKSGK